MFYVIARYEVKAECREAYAKLLQKYLPLFMGEGGCIRYEPCVDCEEKDGRLFITVLESWASQKHHEAHMAGENIANFKKEAQQMRIGSTELLKLNPEYVR